MRLQADLKRGHPFSTYAPRGRGGSRPKCLSSKRGTVNLVLHFGPKCVQGGGGVRNPPKKLRTYFMDGPKPHDRHRSPQIGSKRRPLSSYQSVRAGILHRDHPLMMSRKIFFWILCSLPSRNLSLQYPAFGLSPSPSADVISAVYTKNFGPITWSSKEIQATS